MRKILLGSMLALSLALVGCSSDDDDYEEYHYDGNEKIEMEQDDVQPDIYYIEEDDDRYEYYDN